MMSLLLSNRRNALGFIAAKNKVHHPDTKQDPFYDTILTILNDWRSRQAKVSSPVTQPYKEQLLLQQQQSLIAIDETKGNLFIRLLSTTSQPFLSPVLNNLSKYHATWTSGIIEAVHNSQNFTEGLLKNQEIQNLRDNLSDWLGREKALLYWDDASKITATSAGLPGENLTAEDIILALRHIKKIEDDGRAFIQTLGKMIVKPEAGSFVGAQPGELVMNWGVWNAYQELVKVSV